MVIAGRKNYLRQDNLFRFDMRIIITAGLQTVKYPLTTDIVLIIFGRMNKAVKVFTGSMLLLAFSVTNFSLGFGDILCIGDNGHMEIVSANLPCCDGHNWSTTPSASSTNQVSNYIGDYEDCLDIPLNTFIFYNRPARIENHIFSDIHKGVSPQVYKYEQLTEICNQPSSLKFSLIYVLSETDRNLIGISSVLIC